MNIHCFDATPEEVAYLTKNLPGHTLTCEEKKAQESDTVDSEAEVLSVFVGSTVTKEVLAQFPKLKFIATRSTGFDHIDLKACAERGIQVANVPSYGEHTVAEFAFGLILTLSRKIYPGIKRLKDSGDFEYSGLQGFDLRDKTIGIIGTGRIGRHAVSMAKGFAMKVVAYDPYPNEELAKAERFSYLTLDELLRQSDVVTIHVPYMPATHHILNAEKLALMKPTAILINVSRGGLVDTDALLVALKEKKIGAVGMDVLEEETGIKDEYALLRNGHPDAEKLKILLEDHELIRMPNVIITPHMAFDTVEGVERILRTSVDNIVAYAGGAPTNLVKLG